MERVLYDSKIFKYRSIASSIGGGLDKGRGLSPIGRRLIRDAIERNKVEFINEKHLENSIVERMKIYNKKSKGEPIKAFINVGGGIASLGSTENVQFISSGLSKTLGMKNFPRRGVLILMAEENIPIIHMLNITQLARKYGLPVSPTPLPFPGEGEIFIQRQYSMTLTVIVTTFLMIAIALVFIMDKKRHRLGAEQIPMQKPVT